LQADKRKEIDDFNLRLEASFEDANFVIDGEGEFDSLYFQVIDDDLNSGGVRIEADQTTPSSEDYGDMHTDERPENDDKEAVDKYLKDEAETRTSGEKVTGTTGQRTYWPRPRKPLVR
jgi:hypothetical protein